MKFIKLAILVFLLTFCIPNSSFSQSNSFKYMKNIQSILNESKKEVFQYLKVIVKGRNLKKVESKREKLIDKIDSEHGKFLKIEDSKLKQEGLKYLSTLKIVLTDDYAKIMDIEEIAEQSYDNMEAYFTMQEKANEKLDQAWDNFDTAFHRYARTNNIKIVEGELDKKSQKIRKMSETLKYSNQIYLIYLKCHYQEKKLLESIEKEDINAMTQNMDAQKTLLKSSIEKVLALKSYDHDSRMIHATKYLFKFYKDEVEKDFVTIQNFFILKSKYNTAKKNHESLKESDRASNLAFEKISQEFSSGIIKYNETVKRVNLERSKQIKDWFDILKEFNTDHSNSVD